MREIWQVPTLICWQKKRRKKDKGFVLLYTNYLTTSVKCVLTVFALIYSLLLSSHFSFFPTLLLLICFSFSSSPLLDFSLRFFCNSTTFTKLPFFFFSLWKYFTTIPLYYALLNYPLTQIKGDMDPLTIIQFNDSFYILKSWCK